MLATENATEILRRFKNRQDKRGFFFILECFLVLASRALRLDFVCCILIAFLATFFFLNHLFCTSGQKTVTVPSVLPSPRLMIHQRELVGCV